MPPHNRNWDDLGRDIEHVVDRAVNSHDFRRLNHTICQVIGRVADIGSIAIHSAVQTASAADRSSHPDTKRLYGSTVAKTAAGVLKAVCGIPIGLFGALGFLGTMLDIGTATAGLIIFELLLIAAGFRLTYQGISSLKRFKRFHTYRGLMGGDTHCPVAMLASGIGKPQSFVRKDLQQMIREGLFREGHLDHEGDTLITSHETYRYYEQCRVQQEEQRRQAPAPEQAASSHQNAQVQEVLDKGNAFLAQIRKCNDDIPGEDISRNISDIELIVQQIFQRAAAHPEIVPDLKKLMDYYLPMTVKLLSAYAEMDAQPVRGENIQASKREIEATLDTLNLAYQKLLDDLFMDTAMDVSSDISVLNTLLAQEGLTGDDFTDNKTAGTGDQL